MKRDEKSVIMRITWHLAAHVLLGPRHIMLVINFRSVIVMAHVGLARPAAAVNQAQTKQTQMSREWTAGKREADHHLLGQLISTNQI